MGRALVGRVGEDRGGSVGIPIIDADELWHAAPADLARLARLVGVPVDDAGAWPEREWHDVLGKRVATAIRYQRVRDAALRGGR